MTVKELREALQDVADDVIVTICIPDYVKLNCPEDYMRYVTTAKYCKPTGFSGEEFEIEAGEGFAY